jgi:diaminopropionate ammonia-lyase
MQGTRRLTGNRLLDKSKVSAPDPASCPYHRSWSAYKPTPLHDAPIAAARLGVASVHVKDESERLGLPSFKILGASWATHKALCSFLDLDVEQAPTVMSLKEHLSGHYLTLVAATDGNHGRAVARMARTLGLAAHILVPQDMVEARISALRGEGADVTVVPGGYDDAIAASAVQADTTHVVISDTSWPGYHEIPRWVVDGYSTLSGEIHEQLGAQRLPAPTWVAAQIGVGAFAASIARGFKDGDSRLLGVEPVRADCVITSIEAGRETAVPGPQSSIMAGLNCGVPSPVAWPDVSHGIDVFAAVEDVAAEEAMRLLASDGIISGESGAAGLAGILDFAEELGLDSDDHVLVVSTEGATDPVAYERIVGAKGSAPD